MSCSGLGTACISPLLCRHSSLFSLSVMECLFPGIFIIYTASSQSWMEFSWSPEPRFKIILCWQFYLKNRKLWVSFIISLFSIFLTTYFFFFLISSSVFPANYTGCFQLHWVPYIKPVSTNYMHLCQGSLIFSWVNFPLKSTDAWYIILFVKKPFVTLRRLVTLLWRRWKQPVRVQ